MKSKINYMETLIRNDNGYASYGGIWLRYQNEKGESLTLLDTKHNRKVARMEAVGMIDRQEVVTIARHISRAEETTWLTNYFQKRETLSKKRGVA